MIHVANGGSHSFESATNHPSRPAPPAWGIVAPSSPHEPTYYSSFHPGINSVHPPPSTHSFGSYPYSHHTASTVFSSPDPSHSHSSFLPQSDQPSIVGGGGLPWSIENQHWSDQHGSNQLEIPQTFGSVNSFVPSTPSLHTSSAYEYPDLQAHPTLTNPYDFDPSLFLF
ncbi:uncharacterized protein JCM6883_001390 [Sporobolomyces salmoneus]|uniref:uncharacterized protein n=1 Tax=Sporobolomyces salmoneus TaxID=183962 RepID=UPI003177D79A